MDPILNDIKQRVEEHPVVLFMKGSPDFPQCGFSSRTVQALRACNAEFRHVDVLAEPEVRMNLPRYSNWPTFPQLFIGGRLVGGCDITMDLYHSGELKKQLATVTSLASEAEPEPVTPAYSD